jgi:Zn-dependent M28 family amino/carboxypeptidase
VFVAFDGNNFSLQGSRHFVSRLGIPQGSITCMVNMDQIGSVLSPVGKNPEYLLVLGSNKLKGWQKGQLDFSNEYFGLGLELDYSYYGSQDFYDIFYRLSDQQSFTAAGIPALLFTSGITKHTNKESDNVDNLDVDVLVKRIDLIYRFIWLIL